MPPLPVPKSYWLTLVITTRLGNRYVFETNSVCSIFLFFFSDYLNKFVKTPVVCKRVILELDKDLPFSFNLEIFLTILNLFRLFFSSCINKVIFIWFFLFTKFRLEPSPLCYYIFRSFTFSSVILTNLSMRNPEFWPAEN